MIKLRFFLKRTPLARFAFFLISDVFLIALAVYLSFLLRMEGKIETQYIYPLKIYSALMVGFTVAIFYFRSLYYFTWIYVSIAELLNVIKSVTLSAAIVMAIYFIGRDLPYFQGLPRSIIFINYFLMIIFLGGIRILKRIYLQIFKNKKTGFNMEKRRLLIVGAGDAGEQLLRSILMNRQNFYEPIGFIDDSPLKQKTSIHNVKVLGKIDDLASIVQTEQIQEIIIALPHASSAIIKKTVQNAKQAGLLNIKTLPAVSEIMNGQISLSDVRRIKIEDLLGRQPVQIDTKLIGEFIKDKKILITGAAGSIGSELVKQTLKFKPQALLILDQDETGIFKIKKFIEKYYSSIAVLDEITDIRDKKKIQHIFAAFQPAIVFHAAAYKHVALMEDHPQEAIKNNICGTWIVADAAKKFGAQKFVLISTDKAVNPTSIMGVSKRLAEMAVMNLNFFAGEVKKSHLPAQAKLTKFTAVRFGNVLGSRGSVIPIFQEAIENRRPIEITHPAMKRYFMMIGEAALLVMQAGALGLGGETFVLDMGEPVKILDLAREMIKLSGLEPELDIPIIFTRPHAGEKLFEEILTNQENAQTTKYKQIFIARQTAVKDQNFLNQLKYLLEQIDELNDSDLKKALKKLAPEYQNS